MTAALSYVLDTSALIPLLKPEASLGSVDRQRRSDAEALLKELDDRRVRLIIPTPVVFELLCAHAAESEIASFLSSSQIDVAPLTRSAAEVAAKLMRIEKRRQETKFDACIAGVALSLGHSKIIAYDPFFDGITGLTRIEYPESPTQSMIIFPP